MATGDMLHAFVTVDGTLYNTVLQRATTVTMDPAHEQFVVDLATSLQPMP
jgi:hypothetical protein